MHALTKNWSFSLLLAVVYLGIFHLWMALDRTWIILSSIGVSLGLGSLFVLAVRRRYFLNRWDAFLHSIVILDIFLEGIFIPLHDTRGFYLCALGFAVVIAGYRILLRKRGVTVGGEN